MTPEELQQLLDQLYGYGVTPEALASLPMIPNSYMDKKWNQDAGTYVPTEMPYSKPSTRLWHGQTLLDQLGLTLPMLGEAHGLPTMDVMQTTNPELTNQPGAPAPTPILDSLRSSSNQAAAAIASDVDAGTDLLSIKANLRAGFDNPDDPALADMLQAAEKAWEEKNITPSSGGSSSGSSADGLGDYRGTGDLTPVEQAYAEAGLPMPWETYTGDTLPANALPKNYDRQVSKQAAKGNRFLKSVERFVKDTKQRQDDALTDGEKQASSEVVRKALNGLGILGNDSGPVTAGSDLGGDYSNVDNFTPGVDSMDPRTVQAGFGNPSFDVAPFTGSGEDWVSTFFPDQAAAGAQPFVQNEQGAYVDPATQPSSPWAGGSPEAHAQIAQDLAAYQQQQYEQDRRDLAASRLTAQGRTPSSDAVMAREALARFLGITP